MPLLPETIIALSSIDIQTYFPANAANLTFDEISKHLSEQVSRANEAHRTSDADVLQLLSAIANIYFDEDSQSAPFKPAFVSGTMRSLMSDDLDQTELDAIKLLASKIPNPALQARLLDIVWVHRKDHVACKGAVEAYSAAATNIMSHGDFMDASPLLGRAIYLAACLGRRNALYTETVKLIEDSIPAAQKQGGFEPLRLLQILHASKAIEPVKLSTIAEFEAEKAHTDGDINRERDYLELSADILSGTDQAGSRNSLSKIGNLYVLEARQRGEGSKLIGSISMLKAIEAYRRACAGPKILEPLKAELSTFQKGSVSELRPISAEVSLEDAYEKAVAHVEGKPLKDALARLAFGFPLVDLDTLRARVLKDQKDHLFKNLFDQTIIDSSGRTQQIKKGLLNLTGDEREKAVEAEMFSILTNFDLSIRVQGFIEPARRQISREHFPSQSDLLFLVQSNPFVPPGREQIFLRAITAGFHDDFITASLFLTPQIENSIRYVLEQNGVDISNLMSDSTQPVKILAPLLGLPDTERIFGKQFVFEMRAILIEKTGYDFRNRVAHGFVSAEECFSTPSVLIWWHVIRLCLMPLLKVTREVAGETSESRPQNI